MAIMSAVTAVLLLHSAMNTGNDWKVVSAV